MAKRRKLWSYSVGKRPNTVRVFEREPGGVLYVRVWSPERGNWRRRSLGHRDRKRAEAEAHDMYVKLAQGLDDVRQGRVTLGRLFALYETYRTPRKSANEQNADKRRLELWTRFLGPDKDPHRITLGEWERFIDLRASGAIDPRGNPLASKLDEHGKEIARRAVRARSVEADLKWLRWVLNWGVTWRDREGRYLLRENAVRGYEIPTEKNPRRPVATQNRYEAMRAKSDEVTMEVRWEGKRDVQRSYLSEILDIANGTGRRLSAILGLRYDDLRLDVEPHGAIRWPADTDKTGRETVVPISPLVRAALERAIAERPGIGKTPLFPSPTDRQAPMSRHLADAWLRDAESKAELAVQKGSLWHAYRRKWATERKHLPATDVAAAGGWAGPETLQHCYQQTDEATLLRVVLGGGELQEVM